jgi:hypothetical protein
VKRTAERGQIRDSVQPSASRTRLRFPGNPSDESLGYYLRPLHGLASGFLAIPAMNRWATIIRPLHGLASGFWQFSDESLSHYHSSALRTEGPTFCAKLHMYVECQVESDIERSEDLRALLEPAS